MTVELVKLEKDITSFTNNSVKTTLEAQFGIRPTKLDINGEKIVFKGPSGVGKSTLMKLAMGMIKPTDGEVLIGDVKTYMTTCPTFPLKEKQIFANHLCTLS